MLQTVNHSNNNPLIIALVKKSKRTFSNNKTLLQQQAQYFSPAYRDFVLKLISSSSIKIGKYNGYPSAETEKSSGKGLTKRAVTKLTINASNPNSLAHELGHALDAWFGNDLQFSEIVVVRDGKTLTDIFQEEFSENHRAIFNELINEYEEVVDSELFEGAFEIFLDELPRYRDLLTMPVYKTGNKFNRALIHNRLYDTGFVEIYYEMYTRRLSASLNEKYSPILDALSSKYNLENTFLSHHSVDYYANRPDGPVSEFFANLFAAKVAGKHQLFDNLIKYLPKSFDAFERLFVIIYDHIQKNKKFQDVKLKEGI